MINLRILKEYCQSPILVMKLYFIIIVALVKKDKLSTLWYKLMEIIQITVPDAYNLKDTTNSLITNRVYAKFINNF